MTIDQRIKLQSTLDGLNRLIREIVKDDRGLTRIRPYATYTDDDDAAKIKVEVTTGRFVLETDI